jgi:hypothetical protein
MLQEKEYREKLKKLLKQIEGHFNIAEVRGNNVGSFIFAKKENRAIEIYQSEDAVIVEFWENEEQKTEKEIDSYSQAAKLVIDWINKNHEK